jgi:hypothetical protein
MSVNSSEFSLTDAEKQYMEQWKKYWGSNNPFFIFEASNEEEKEVISSLMKKSISYFNSLPDLRKETEFHQRKIAKADSDFYPDAEIFTKGQLNWLCYQARK